MRVAAFSKKALEDRMLGQNYKTGWVTDARQRMAVTIAFVVKVHAACRDDEYRCVSY